MQKMLPKLWQGYLYAATVVLLTWLFFGPITGFHHMIRCGLLCPICLDSDSPEGGHLIWGEFEVLFFPARIALSVVLYGLCLFFVMRYLRAQLSLVAAPIAAPAGQPAFRLRLAVYLALAIVLAELGVYPVGVVAFGFFAPPLISILAVICGYCSVKSLFSERGFDHVVAGLSAAVALGALLRFSSLLWTIIP